MSGAGNVVVVRAEAFASTGAAQIAEAVRRAGGGSLVSVALAGGSTPRQVYRALALEPGVPWDRVEVFFGDERAVPPDDPASNWRMAREALIERLPAPPAAVHRMAADEADLEAAAAAYAALLPAALDVLVLGVGPDGHTASLFPGSEAVGEARRLVVPALGPVPPRRRLTVTPPVIERARAVIVLAAGESKAGAVREALRGPLDPAACPAQLARRGTWILDAAAAGAASW